MAQDRPQTVGELEEALFAAFPRKTAEPWDNVGLSVGNRRARIARVAFDLDQGVGSVLAAAREGCNVLVTHHPPFVKEGPRELGPADQDGTPGPGRALFEAARLGVNVIAVHTNADRSPAVRERFADLLGWRCAGSFEALLDPSLDGCGPGLGAVFEFGDAGTDLLAVANRCKDAFGGAPRVWGAPGRRIGRLAFLNGSWMDPDLYGSCIAAGVDCVVVGETGYHLCVDAGPFLSVVELGHDRSELPIVDVLKDVVAGCGFGDGELVELGLSAHNWWTPERA